MDWIGEIISFVVGLASGFTLKVAIDQRTVKVSNTGPVQSGNRVGGDLAGRDIKKRP